MSRFFQQFTGRPLFEREQPIKAVVLLGSLKKNINSSTTYKVCRELEKHMDGIVFDYVHLSTMKIDVGIKIKNDTPGDKMEGVYEKIKAADIVIFATPIWWGSPSSLIQKIIERLDETDNRCYKAANAESLGEKKVLGVVITGADDNAQACIQRILGWGSHLGFTSPGFNSVTYLGTYGDFDEWAKDNCYLQVMGERLIECAHHCRGK